MTAQCIDVPADEVDAFISEKMTDYAGDYVDMQRLFGICDNKPMIGGRSLRAHGRDEPRRRRGRLPRSLPRQGLGAFRDRRRAPRRALVVGSYLRELTSSA